jgi:hypothetical protein
MFGSRGDRMADTDCTIKLTGTGLTLDRKISQDLANRIVMLVLSDGKQDVVERGGGDGGGPLPSPDQATAATKAQAAPGRTTSLSEYLNQHSVQKTPQRIAAIGQYYQVNTKKSYFTRAELETGFEDARVKVPKNINRDLGLTINKGWIAPKQGQAKAYYVTGTGETAIANNFAGDRKGGRRKKKKGKNTTK